MGSAEMKNEYIYDFANRIRYLLSYSKNESQFFEKLIRNGVLLISENNTYKFKTPFWTLSDTELAKLTEDEFFLTENLMENMGYNLRRPREGGQ